MGDICRFVAFVHLIRSNSEEHYDYVTEASDWNESPESSSAGTVPLVIHIS